jgi:spore coat protein U-like protein
MKRQRSSRIARYLCSALLLQLLSAAEGWTASPQELTALSLEALMEMDLPAGGPSARFQVSATAVDSCDVTASDLAFGTYDPLNPTPTDADSRVTVTCTVDTGYAIGLDAGIGSGATVATRKLSNDSDVIDYSLYRDSGRSLVWGYNSESDTATGVGTGMPAETPIYGRIPPKQPVKRGVYTDTVTVWIIF